MAYVIFNKDHPNHQGAIIRLKPTGTDITSFSELGYQVCEINDSQYNDIRLQRKVPSYDDSGNIILSNPSYVDGKTENAIPIWDTVEDLQTHINNLIDNNPSTNDKDADYNAQIISLQSKDLSGLTYPIQKTIPEIAEDQGITWLSRIR